VKKEISEIEKRRLGAKLPPVIYEEGNPLFFSWFI
jgi:hypothetical protein